MTRFGAYSVEGVLGEGAVGTVYEAVDPEGRRVALKALKSVDGVDRARFEREIEVLRRLSHPSIVRVLDASSQDGRPFFVMELLRGPTLRDRMKEGAPLGELVPYIVDVARALDAAHRSGVIHRDVKPGNVLLGADRRARLGDFGLARDLQSAEKLTTTNTSMGTPAYMAPEQAAARATDARTDVYALGAVLYEAIAGEPPFVRPSLVELLQAILVSEPAPPSRGTRPALDEVCLKALAKAPEDRHATAAELAAAIESAFGVGRRRRWLAAALLLLLSPLLLLLRESPAARDLAEADRALAEAERLHASRDPGAEEAAARALTLSRPGSREATASARLLAIIRVARGDSIDAREPLDIAERGGASDPEFLVALARMENDLGFPTDLAFQHAFRAACGAPSLWAAHIEAARAAERCGNFSMAGVLYDQALDLSKGDHAVALRLVDVLLVRGKEERAIATLATYAGEDAALQAKLGFLQLHSGRLGAAERAFRTALAVDPANVPARNGLAATLLDAHRTEEAIELLSGITAEVREDAVAWHNLARALRERGDLDQAALAIERARALEPSNVEHAKEAGRAALARLRLSEAEAAFRDAIRLDDADVEAALSLAALLARQDRADEARAELRRIDAERPGDPRVAAALRSLGH